MDGVRTRRFTVVRCLYSNGYIPKEAIAVQNTVIRQIYQFTVVYN
ncbi:MAG: hypothetical protein V7L31_18420 [Nostoc sp.]